MHLTLKRLWGGGIKTLHFWRLPVWTGMKFGLSNLHVFFIFGVWNNRGTWILVVDFKIFKNFSFEKKFLFTTKAKILKNKIFANFPKNFNWIIFLEAKFELRMCSAFIWCAYCLSEPKLKFSYNLHWRSIIQKCPKFGHLPNPTDCTCMTSRCLDRCEMTPRMIFYKDFVKTYLFIEIP